MNGLRKSALPVFAAILIAAQLLAACGPAALAASSSKADPHMAMDMPADQAAAAAPATGKTDPLAFRQAMRRLWEDHITWTRVYIISAVAGLPEADAAAARLLQNQVDIGNAIKPFYGDAAGDQLTTLLKEHITIAVELLAAAKAGDTTKFADAQQRWYDNANEIAAFLNQANPDQWPLADMQSMMKSHLDLTLEEASARLNGDWAADVAAYGKVTDEILGMDDMLSDGIIKQFPGSFHTQKASQAHESLALAMDKQWEDHVQWTRFYIMSTTAGLPDADAAAGRLLQNQVDIGDAIKPLYGEAAGDQLTTLLKTHITTAVTLLAAAKAGDQAAFAKAKNDWYRNADEIADFLSKANPDHWRFSDMKSMMRDHLDLTLAEATARLKGDWTADVAAYDSVHAEILEMSGMLTEGIVEQFPSQFK